MKTLEKTGRKVRSYSEALKLEVVSDIELGKHTAREAGIIYEIPESTIRDWVKKYGRGEARNEKIIGIMMKDQKERIQELESALSDAHLKLRIYEETMKVACKEQGFELKKNITTGELKVVRRAALKGTAK